MRLSEVSRKTSETNVYIQLNLDSEGSVQVATGICFLDKMLKILANYGSININVRATGDMRHHIQSQSRRSYISQS